MEFIKFKNLLIFPGTLLGEKHRSSQKDGNQNGNQALWLPFCIKAPANYCYRSARARQRFLKNAIPQ